ICNSYPVASGITKLQQAFVERAQTMFRSVVDARAVRSVVTECEAIATSEIIADKWGAAF
ncbi:hypothetical protein EV421DRAFT_1722339, partial [Armillaria borealis]